MSQDTGNEKMRDIADAIRLGAEAYLRRQYRTISIIAIIFAAVFAFVIRDSSNPLLGPQTALGFIVGAGCSSLAGYIAMYISVRSNVRTAQASTAGLNPALQVAFRGGMVFGLAVVSMSLLGISGLYLLFTTVFGKSPDVAPSLIVGFAFGASFAALFAQLGGGIYTKAADVSADLVGKVEEGIPEDDPRNPAVVADLVGDNVGDIAGRGADLFESIRGENIGAMILVAGLSTFAATIAGYDVVSWVLFPLVARAFGLLSAIVGMFFVFARGKEDPFRPLARGLVVTAVLAMGGFYFATVWLLGSANLNMFFAALTGIVAAVFITLISNYYTSYSKRPVREISNAAQSGPAPGVIQGLAVGMESTGLFVIVIVGALIIAYVLGGGVDALKDPLASTSSPRAIALGIYGTATAAMGMLSVTPMILAMDVFVFSSLAIRAVGKTAAEMIQEVRRQFREIPGIMAGTAKPDYARCVDISTSSALRNMIAPSLLVVLTPIIVGLILGPEAIGSLLMIGTVAGILLALFMNNGGGAMDNAKKYVEAGFLGGKGSPTHAATVIGDTVGDPLKDTAGPSLHVVIKLLNTITLALAPLFILYALLA